MMKRQIFTAMFFCVCMFFALTVCADYAEYCDNGVLYCTESLNNDVALCGDEADIIRLDTPTNLKWNVTETGEKENGYISWDAVEKCEGAYSIVVYCGDIIVHSATTISLYDYDGNGRVGLDVASHDVFSKSGTYYFTIIAHGDNTKYGNSEMAKSEGYEFMCPKRKMECPTQLEWVEFGVLRHKNIKNAKGYVYQLYNDEFEIMASTTRFGTEEYTTIDIIYILEQFKDATKVVYVTVKAKTPDIEIYMNSDESEFSPSLDIERNTEIGKNELLNVINKLASGEISASEAVDEFKSALEDNDISNSALATSMQQDDELVDNIAILENEFMSETGIETNIVDNSCSYLEEKGIDVSDIQIVGASLNSESGNDVALVFDTPDPTISLDPLFYKNVVGIGIDMEGVYNNQNLEIPVQIRMPIPENVLPERLMIVHCHKDGSQEVIYPVVETIGGKYYAKFVLTSFSTFVFCNKEFDVGDINKDGEIDKNDAILLLQHSMFPELYPLDYAGSVDFTGDGVIDMNDAILLLQHSMFPELYPID